MSSISITKLYDLLSTKMGRETAENLTSYIEGKIRDEFDGKTQILATKADILATKADIQATKADIANAKTDMIEWMFIFWIGQVGATFGFILLFLKK